VDKSAALQNRVNAEFWRCGGHVNDYAAGGLKAAESSICRQMRPLLSGRVLDVGCGAGRLLGPLLAIGADVHGLDISHDMVQRCRERCPAARLGVGDVADGVPGDWGDFDAILASDQVLDVFSDDARRRVLAELAGRLRPRGVLGFSSHNLRAAGDSGIGASAAGLARIGRYVLLRDPREMPGRVMSLVRRARNRRRLARGVRRAERYAILNDEAHEHALLHYYISRDEQARQLTELGLELILCLDANGSVVPDGESGRAPWLHYVARNTAPVGTGATAKGFGLRRRKLRRACMRYSVGIDLVDVEQVADAVACHGQRYLDRIYTPCELSESRQQPERLAARFAAKEAAMKALRRGPDEPLPWREISVVHDDAGRPALQLTGATARLATRTGVRGLDVSLTHESGRALAIVLAERAA